MAYRNKTYVAFDGDEDIRYYRLMTAWKANDGMEFNFHDAHDLNSASDTSTEESIKRQLAVRMQNSKVFVILIGEKTKYLRKFVPWEIEQAVKRDLPIIAVNLNKSRDFDGHRCPAALRGELAIHIPFGQEAMRYALDKWPESHRSHRLRKETGPHHYNNLVYSRLGLQADA